MVIDPRIYEKYSGKKGDAAGRLGAALAQNAQAKQQRQAQKVDSFSTRYYVGAFKWRLYAGAAVCIIITIWLVYMAITGKW